MLLLYSSWYHFLEGEYWYDTVYFESSHGRINKIKVTPPTFWTTAEISVGLLAACLPTMMPLMRRLPSPERTYNLLSYTLTPRRSGQIKAPERLSSVENTPKTYGSSENMMGLARGVEVEMSDYRRTEVEEDAGFSRAVWSLCVSCLEYSFVEVPNWTSTRPS